MSFAHLKHPMKQKLDLAEAVALELLAALEVAGIKVKKILEDEIIYLYILDLPEDCRLGLELDFSMNGSVLELICKSREDPNGEKNSFFRLFWCEESGWAIELETVAPDVEANLLARAIGKHHGLDQKGDTKTLKEGEHGVVLEDIIGFINVAPLSSSER